MQTILLATDFSEASENAYRYCLELGSKTRTQIFVAHIYKQQNSIALNEDQRIRNHQQEFEAFRQRTIRFSRLYPDTTTPELLAHCLVSTDVEAGIASSKLLELTERHHADVLILGAKRYPGLFKKLFGQVSLRLIYSPSCAVLVVPEEYKGGYPERIGALCVDDQDEEYLSNWVKKAELLNGIETEYYLLHSNVDTPTPSLPADGRHVISRDGDDLLNRLDEADADMFVIKSGGGQQDDRKSLIHFLYDHLGLPLLCLQGDSRGERREEG